MHLKQLPGRFYGPMHLKRKLKKRRCAKNHFHKNGLRTDPSAENTTESDGKQHNANYTSQHGQHKQKEILRPKNLPEYNKATLHYIEQQHRVPANP